MTRNMTRWRLQRSVAGAVSAMLLCTAATSPPRIILPAEAR